MKTSSFLAKRTKNGETKTPRKKDRAIDCAAINCAEPISFAPTCLAIILAEPILREEKTMEIIKKMVLDSPTAAMAAVPRHTTIIVSEIKTVICKMFSMINGMLSLIMFLFRLFSVSSSILLQISVNFGKIRLVYYKNII